MEFRVSRGKTVFLVAVVLVGVLVGGFYLYQQSQRPPHTMEEFRANSTPYLQQEVSASLEGLGCEPKGFYFNKTGKNKLCFPCDGLKACFEYSNVNRSGDVKRWSSSGEKMLVGDHTPEEKFGFYTGGISRILDCSCKYDRCSCREGITISDRSSVMYQYRLPENVSQEDYLEMVREGTESSCETNVYGSTTKTECGALMTEYWSNDTGVAGWN